VAIRADGNRAAAAVGRLRMAPGALGPGSKLRAQLKLADPRKSKESRKIGHLGDVFATRIKSKRQR
jgi:hypothetical protein